jgi:hypothetical protein
MSGAGPSGVAGFLRRRSGGFKAGIALVGPTTAIVSKLLALGVISPFGQEDAIAKGLETTRATSTSLVSIELEVRKPASGSGPTSFSAQGAFDHETGRGRLSFDFGGTEGLESASNVEAIFAGRVVYLKGDLPAGAKPSEKPWLRLEPAAVAERLRKLQQLDEPVDLPVDLSFVGKTDFVDPSQALDYLERSSDLEPVGERTLFGRKTTLYAGGFTEKGGRFKVRVWIDEDDLIRRLEVTGGREDITYTVRFRDFDVKVDAQPPPPGQVIDAMRVLDQISGATGSP